MKNDIENLEDLLEEETSKIKDSEVLYRNLFDTMAEGVVLINSDGQIIHANAAAERILGLKRSEIESLSYVAPEWEIFRSDGTPMPPEEMAGPRAMKEKRLVKDIVMGVKRPDGIISWINVSAVPLIIKNKFTGIVSTFTDISERKLAEEALRESEERYRGLYESSRDGIVSSDIEGNIVDCNQAYADMHDITKAELLKMSIWDLIHDKWRDEQVKIFNEQMLNRGYSDEFEIEHIKKDGTIFPVSGRAWHRKDKDGNIIGGWGIIRDISERKRAEKALWESEKRWRSLFEDSRDPIYIITREGEFIEVNEAMIELFGYNKDELLMLNALELYVHSEDRAKFQKEIEKMRSVRDYEVKFLKKDGTKIDCLLTSSVRCSDDGSILGYQGIIRDITEQKLAEHALQTSKELYKTLASLLLMQGKKKP